MSTMSETQTSPAVGQLLGVVVGLGITAMSMSSGFIWASQGRLPLVYVAGFLSWTGYLIAHKAATGVFVDDVDGPAAEVETTEDGNQTGDSPGANGSLSMALSKLRSIAPEDTRRALGFVLGIAILVSGIAILAWYVRQENHLLGNVGSGLFLGGYVIAHYFDSEKLL